jgi:aspartyl-tRNA(Asn)/glutamyl-tRNA(Gln) amidotransferase subunit A
LALNHASPDSFHSITELAPQIVSGEVKPSSLLETCIQRIEENDPSLNAYITRTFDLARQKAEERDDEITRGECRGPLHGIPIALKDLIDLEGSPTTAGSLISKDHIPPRTAPCAQRLVDAGAVIVGKTNLQEFARGGTGANSYFGPTKNPWDLERTPGGSSSGSAASVAAGMSAAAIGSDTGGSIRCPAAYCGLAGIRSTYGRVSRTGAVPLGLSFDNVGPLARTVEDCAIILQAIAGPEPLDPTTGNQPPPDFRASIEKGIEGMTFGIPTNHFWPGFEPEVEDIVREAIAELEKLGARLVEVNIPWAVLGDIAYAAVVGPESAEYHRENLRDRREDFNGPGADFFEQSLFVPGWRYVQAQRARTYFIRQAASVFREVDAILTPTSPIVAPTIAQPLHGPLQPDRQPGPSGAMRLHAKRHASGPSNCGEVGRRGASFPDRLGIRIGTSLVEAPPAGIIDGGNGMTEREFTPDEIRAMAESMGHNIQPNRLSDLTAGVNRLNATLDKLNSLDLGDCERAETLDLLSIRLEDLPEVE